LTKGYIWCVIAYYMATPPYGIETLRLQALVGSITGPTKELNGPRKESLCGLSSEEVQELINQRGVIELIHGHINPATKKEYPSDNPLGGNIIIAQKRPDISPSKTELILSFRYDLPDGEYYKLRLRYIPGESTIVSDIYLSTTQKSAGHTYDGEDNVIHQITPEHITQLFEICNRQSKVNQFNGY
jgi:hypothetical protein